MCICINTSSCFRANHTSTKWVATSCQDFHELRGWLGYNTFYLKCLQRRRRHLHQPHRHLLAKASIAIMADKNALLTTTTSHIASTALEILMDTNTATPVRFLLEIQFRSVKWPPLRCVQWDWNLDPQWRWERNSLLFAWFRYEWQHHCSGERRSLHLDPRLTVHSEFQFTAVINTFMTAPKPSQYFSRTVRKVFAQGSWLSPWHCYFKDHNISKIFSIVVR